MKIIILHGDDTEKLYERLTKFIEVAKKRNWEIVDYSLEAVANQSLFDTEKFFILRDFKKLSKKDISNLGKYSGNLVIYHQGNVPALFIKSLGKDVVVEKFSLPQLLWKFLDNMTLEGLSKLLETQPVEFIFSMIAWKLRQKYTRNPSKENGNQIKTLSEIDIKAKIGKANIKQSLDLFIIKGLS